MKPVRSIALALAALGVSATVVFAGQAVSNRNPIAQTGPQVAEESESPEPSESPDADATENAAEHPDNHGKAVSEAAHVSPLPTGYDSRGDYVSSVAKDNNGHSGDHGKP